MTARQNAKFVTARRLADHATVEVAPGSLITGSPLSELLPSGTAVYVPYLPRAHFEDSVAACRSVVCEGMYPVPHLPARVVPSRWHLQDWLARLSDVGVEALFLISGDVDSPRGSFRDTFGILESGLLQRYGFRRLGVAGYPDGHPEIDTATLNRALADKAAYARDTETDLWVVTQFTFAVKPIVEWLTVLRDMGVSLPVRVGVPGPAKLQTLLAYALRCGVGASARTLVRRPTMARKLVGRWSPDAFLVDLARNCDGDAESMIEGIHLFPFGGIRQSADWLRTVQRRTGETVPQRRVAPPSAWTS